MGCELNAAPAAATVDTQVDTQVAPQVAIIGGGYAGMAAALELVQRGIPVDVFEAASRLGGRARSVRLAEAEVDNGPHLLVGAYRETLRLLRLLGSEDDLSAQLLRLPLTLVYPGAAAIRASPWPRSLPAGVATSLELASALLLARGLTLADKWAALRFMRSMGNCAFHLRTDCSVEQLLAAHRQPPRLCRYLWHPLCLAALNTPPEAASAQVFANVLRDTLAGGRAASDMLLPRVDLGSLFPDRAARHVAARGGRIRLRSAVRGMARDAQGFVLAGREHVLGRYRQVIVAVAPWHVPALLAGITGLEDLRRQLTAMRWEPIVTSYLAYGPGLRLPLPMLGHTGGHMQWLFDRGQLGGPPGLLAAVISANGSHQRLSNAELAAAVHAEIAALLAGLQGARAAPLRSPLWCRTIRERRATFACTPGLNRPPGTTGIPGLLLAGDYVAGDYPATLEAAVRSGVASAGLVSGVEATAGQP